MHSTTLLFKASRPRLAVFAAALGVLLVAPALTPRVASAGLFGQSSSDTETLAAYLQRLGRVSPRSAPEHVELAQWCQEHGLAAQATAAYEKAVAIDSECEPARLALGYQRYGTGWRKPSNKRSSATDDGATATDERATTPAATPAAGGTGGAETAAPPPESGEEAEATTVSRPEDETARRLEEKREWARAAAEKFGVELSTIETTDFMLHSTLSKRDAKLVTLVRHLKKVKKDVTGATNTRTKVIWPDKLQIVLLRSEPEYERFALNIDGLKSARNPRGGYTAGDHTVIWNPESQVIATAAGATALDGLGGSRRWVGWWLREGVAELVLSVDATSQAKHLYENAFIDSAKTLENDADNALIYQLLETPENSGKGVERNQALAMTFIDYLRTASKSRFRDLISRLKSDDAPAPPATEDEFAAFYSTYVAFQEETLQKYFRKPVPKLAEQWKAFVMKKAAKLEADLAKAGEARDAGGRDRGRGGDGGTTDPREGGRRRR